MNKLDLRNCDNMELMSEFEDNYFDLAIVDPPYGIDADKKNNGKNSDTHEKTSLAKINTYKKTQWDSKVPDKEYFEELFRVSKNQIIWGCNYFNHLNGGGRLFWDKVVTMPTYSRGELAFLSFKNSIDYFQFQWHGMLQGDMKNKELRFHPTQKPKALYKWLLQNYAKEGDKILDTHLGSGSIAIACHEMGFELTGCELDKDYFEAMQKRIKIETAQGDLFQ